MVKRFNIISDRMCYKEKGHWVLYEDYKELEDKYNRLLNSDPYVKEERPEMITFVVHD